MPLKRSTLSGPTSNDRPICEPAAASGVLADGLDREPDSIPEPTAISGTWLILVAVDQFGNQSLPSNILSIFSFLVGIPRAPFYREAPGETLVPFRRDERSHVWGAAFAHGQKLGDDQPETQRP